MVKKKIKKKHFSAGIPAVSVCLGNLSAFQLPDSLFTGKVTGELSWDAERSCQSLIHTHIHKTASTHLSQGHVVMIPPCEQVFVCVCVCEFISTSDVSNVWLLDALFDFSSDFWIYPSIIAQFNHIVVNIWTKWRQLLSPVDGSGLDTSHSLKSSFKGLKEGRMKADICHMQVNTTPR